MEFKQPSLVQRRGEQDGKDHTLKQCSSPVAYLCHELGVTCSSVVSDHQCLDTIPITTNRRAAK